MKNSDIGKPTCVGKESNIQLQLVDDSMVLSEDKTSVNDNDSGLSMRLSGLDATSMVLTHGDCPSYIKMDAYIDEDLTMDCWLSECGDSVSWQGISRKLSLSSPELCPESVFPFYSPKTVRRKDLQDLLPRQPPVGINVSNYLGPAPTSKPLRYAEWKTLLAEWTDPSHPPSNLKELLRAGCPPEMRAHAWNLLIIRQTSMRRQITQYASAHTKGLTWASSKEGRKCPEVQQINNLMLSTPEPALAGQLRVRRVLLALHQTLQITEFHFIHCLVTAILPVLNDDEEGTFWAVVALHDSILPNDYFNADSNAAENDGRILWSLLQMFAPDLHRVLMNLPGGSSKNVIARITALWRQTVLLGCFHPQLVWRLWDVLLLEGERMLFRYQVALFRILQPLLTCVDSVDGVKKLLMMAGDLVRDVEAVTLIVNEELGDITGKLLTKLRRKGRS